jgi:hypothetical protein
MPGHGSQLSRRKEIAIAALLNNRTTEEAAREAGISSRVLLRWMKRPDFREAWLIARREVLSQAIARLQLATGAATNMLLKAMVDPTLTAAQRMRAAQSVLTLSQKGYEQEDLEVRIARLEQRQPAEDGEMNNSSDLANACP